jgi:transglutaminase-like putative cysteine protease
MRFLLGSELNYDILSPTTLIINIEAMRAGTQVVLSDRFTVNPDLRHDLHFPVETGNAYRRILAQPGPLTIRYEALVETSPRLDDPSQVPLIPVADLPLDALAYLYPSRYCQSDKLARFAWRQFGSIPDGHGKVEAICNWIFEEVDYLEASSDSSTSAIDTFSTRAGVCRDFAHLGVTLCRALGIPARFVSAYGWQLTPQDFHAVFEAFLGGRWYLFDATRLCPLDGIVRIGIGRDAADTAFTTFYGALNSRPKMVWIRPAGGEDATRPWTVEAVSVAGA